MSDPAFPFHYRDFQPDSGIEVTREQYSGLSKREYIAARLLSGILANPDGFTSKHEAVLAAVDYADRLLAALNPAQPESRGEGL